jgi:hypothetical protein
MKIVGAEEQEEKRAKSMETKDNRTVGQGVDFGKSTSNSGLSVY